MTKEQLAERIGNINEEFIHESDSQDIYQNVHVSHRPRRMVAMVAVIALMVASFAVGAFAATSMDKADPRPAEELVSFDGMNIKLILPDDWAGRYDIEDLSSDDYPESYYAFYDKATHDQFLEDQKNGVENWFEGRFFILAKFADKPMTPQEVEDESIVPTKYLFATDDATYVLAFASDVQVNWEDEEAVARYQEMREQASEISFVLPSLLSD